MLEGCQVGSGSWRGEGAALRGGCGGELAWEAVEDQGGEGETLEGGACVSELAWEAGPLSSAVNLTSSLPLQPLENSAEARALSSSRALSSELGSKFHVATGFQPPGM